MAAPRHGIIARQNGQAGQRMGYLNEPTPPLQRDRGHLLSGWLIFFFAANALSVIRALEQRNGLVLLWSLFGVLCAVGLWNWYKLAYYGMFIGFLFNIALSLDNASVSGVMFQLVYMGLTYFLVQPKLDYLR
ncbi:MAG: hypothetical protein HZC41_07080 [Chloroflexi bacterium]|nr:hypothetical protein [Chloroflexota bacterium]